MKRRRKSTAKKTESDGSSAAEESPPSVAEFSFALTRVAVSQICRSVGLRAAEFSALETLTLIATKYMQCLAGVCASLSNAANRTESNLFDVVNGLRDLSFSCNRFCGGSAVHDADAHCLIRLGVLRDLSDFVGSTPEIPFAKPVPRRKTGGDISRFPHGPPSPPPPNHVPAWLPSFPDASLYLESCAKQRSDHLWENSGPVSDTFSNGETPLGISKSDGSGGRCGGELPEWREKVRFKLEQKAKPTDKCGGACRSGDGVVRRWDNNGGDADGEPQDRQKRKRT